MLGVINVPIGGFKGVGQGGHGPPDLAVNKFQQRPSGASRIQETLFHAPNPAGRAYSAPQTHYLVGSRLDSPLHKYRKRAIGRLSLRLRPFGLHP